MRQLARIVTIDKLVKHPNADRLEIASVGLWNIVTSVGQFTEGCEAILCEIDCMLPLEDERFSFLKGRNEYVVDAKFYSRLKTTRLRKVLSQGLLLPLHEFASELEAFRSDSNTHSTLADALGIIKYEPPEDNFTHTAVRGSSGGKPFPYFIHKTDQERIQNLTHEYNEIAKRFDSGRIEDYELFEITYKLDGSSITIYAKDGKLGVCSRNLELPLPYDWAEWQNAESHFIKAAINSGLLFKLALYHSQTGRNIAFQGELVGPGIQNNFEGLKEHQIFIYDVFDIDAGKYLLPEERRWLIIHEMYVAHVPTYSMNAWLPYPIEKILEQADGESGLNGKFREGLVYKSMERDFSFKAISNSYLEKTGK